MKPNTHNKARRKYFAVSAFALGIVAMLVITMIPGPAEVTTSVRADYGTPTYNAFSISYMKFVHAPTSSLEDEVIVTDSSGRECQWGKEWLTDVSWSTEYQLSDDTRIDYIYCHVWIMDEDHYEEMVDLFRLSLVIKDPWGNIKYTNTDVQLDPEHPFMVNTHSLQTMQYHYANYKADVGDLYFDISGDWTITASLYLWM